MPKKHRFHFKIDNELLTDLDVLSKSMKYNRSSLINLILKEMTAVINKYNLIEGNDIQINDLSDFESDVIINLEDEFYNQLRYLHFKFASFSMATILRRILRLYVVRCKCSLNMFIKEVEKYLKNQSNCKNNNKTHMKKKESKITRIIAIDQTFRIDFSIGFT